MLFRMIGWKRSNGSAYFREIVSDGDGNNDASVTAETGYARMESKIQIRIDARISC
jgi:hypothetical protein